MTGMRIDKLLWHLRFTKSRSLAQKLITQGFVRIDNERTLSPSASVRSGQCVTLTMNERLRVIRVERIPARRGPAPEAQSCYTEVLPTRAIDAPLHCD
jgi:ribosome-associated heat shock protein Hsp15